MFNTKMYGVIDRFRTEIFGNMPLWLERGDASLRRMNKLFRWTVGTNITPQIYVDESNEAIICIYDDKVLMCETLIYNLYGMNHYARLYISTNPVF